MSRDLTFRVARPDDIPGLLELWEESGWGKMDEKTWREWYVDTPHGESIVSIALDADGRILGQEVFLPTRAVIAGREVKALHLSAPILSSRIRKESLVDLSHPVVGIFKAGLEAAAESGHHVIFAMPQRGWLVRLRATHRVGLPDSTAGQYSCVSIPIAPVNNTREVTCAPLDTDLIRSRSDELDTLWAAARESFPIECGVVRDAGWLEYRNGEHTELYEVREPGSNELIGYSAVRREDGLLYDILARDRECLKVVLAATINRLAGLTVEHRPFGGKLLKALLVPSLADVFEELGFTPVDFKFGFWCYRVNPSINLEDVAPDRWFIQPGD